MDKEKLRKELKAAGVSLYETRPEPLGEYVKFTDEDGNDLTQDLSQIVKITHQKGDTPDDVKITFHLNDGINIEVDGFFSIEYFSVK